MFHLGKLGWRNPRPNDFNTPDKRPLRDLFGNLQKHMTWPHFGFDIDAQGSSTSYTQKTITAKEDPYQLISAADTIQVPRDFDRWLCIGNAGAFVADQAGRHLFGWMYNGAAISELIDERHFVGTVDMRMMCPIVFPVKKGDTLSIAYQSPVASLMLDGQGWGYFLPLA